MSLVDSAVDVILSVVAVVDVAGAAVVVTAGSSWTPCVFDMFSVDGTLTHISDVNGSVVDDV